MILGPCGAGKSTLARVLGDRLHLPVHHMDRLAWRPGWVDSSRDEVRAALAPIVAGQRWIIDGNYGSTLDQRLARADTALLLDYPIPLCLWRLVRRIVGHRGTSRPDMTEGCPERFDPAFFVYVARWRWNAGPRTEARLRGFNGAIVRLRSPAALDRWLTALPA